MKSGKIREFDNFGVRIKPGLKVKKLWQPRSVSFVRRNLASARRQSGCDAELAVVRWTVVNGQQLVALFGMPFMAALETVKSGAAIAKKVKI